jgi:hypothetical protein
MLESSKLLTGILEKTVEIYSYVYQFKSATRDLNMYTEILDDLYTGFDNKIFESKVVEDEKCQNGKFYILYRSEFEFRNSRNYQIAKMFYYNKNISKNEEILEMTNGNSEIFKTLSKKEIELLNSLNYENTLMKLENSSDYDKDFNKLHYQLLDNENNTKFIFNNLDKNYEIVKVNSLFPKDELTYKKEGILIKEVGSNDFIYHESNVSGNDLCYVSINGLEFAGTMMYGDALKLGLNKHLFNSNELPMYEILDNETKTELKEIFSTYF